MFMSEYYDKTREGMVGHHPCDGPTDQRSYYEKFKDRLKEKIREGGTVSEWEIDSLLLMKEICKWDEYLKEAA